MDTTLFIVLLSVPFILYLVRLILGIPLIGVISGLYLLLFGSWLVYSNTLIEVSYYYDNTTSSWKSLSVAIPFQPYVSIFLCILATTSLMYEFMRVIE
jgi:hypothetical protein